ncbi:hypothetical protein SAMN02745121_03179 [Nannocystis exedens]|uniref:Uncharacterized protein n=1 Tax=Nannocystis exedens TaxID=54 RepID=A0A1I1Y745_9BACT|nr:hypothetical protein NAEX_04906 [Nannocystis exedens]SFE14828.1 hypothetical protein SAMN02745121_03179 [Nannocystis exedens]
MTGPDVHLADGVRVGTVVARECTARPQRRASRGGWLRRALADQPPPSIR